MLTEKTLHLAAQVIDRLRADNLTIVTAESCTGGLIAAALTAVPGASEVVYGGFVTYANEAKMSMIMVNTKTLDTYGAVSQPVAHAMAIGAIEQSKADISIAVTGVAGPGGGTKEKPVGLVHLACDCNSKTTHLELRLGNIGRKNVRLATVDAALELVLKAISAQE